MPIWLRTFYIRSIGDVHDQKQQAQEEAKRKAKTRPPSKPSFKRR